MSRVQVEPTTAYKPMDVAIAEAFAHYGRPLLGGKSTDGWSGIADLQRCPYRYKLRHELKIEIPGPVSPALEVGSLVHAAMALHYARQLPKGAPGWHEIQISPLEFIKAVANLGADPVNVAQAERLVFGYLETYPPDDMEPLAVEMEAGVPGTHTCRFDLVARYQNALWIVEHKTATRETSDIMDAWFLDGEVLGELYGWRLSNLDARFGKPVGVLINLMFKRSPPTYRRLEVVIPPVVLDAYIKDRAHWAEVREGYRKTGYWPRKLSGCLSRYDLCSFWSHCRDGSFVAWK